MTTSTHPRHIGLDRVLNASSAAKRTIHDVSSKPMLGKVLLVVGIIAAVTFTSRQFDLESDGFMAQWILQCLVAGAAFWLISLVVWPVVTFANRKVRAAVRYLQLKAQDEAFYDAALADPRIMRDIAAAKYRQLDQY